MERRKSKLQNLHYYLHAFGIILISIITIISRENVFWRDDQDEHGLEGLVYIKRRALTLTLGLNEIMTDNFPRRLITSFVSQRLLAKHKTSQPKTVSQLAQQVDIQSSDILQQD